MSLPPKLAFLQAVVGPDGAAALLKAESELPELAATIYPRSLLAWLEAVGDYDGNLPGTKTHAQFRKSDGFYVGAINVDGAPYQFEGDIFHVAGAVAVSLGIDGQPVGDARQPLLKKLGRQVDLLVKSRLLTEELRKAGAKIQPPAEFAKPRGPVPPIAPQATQPKHAASDFDESPPSKPNGTTLPKPVKKPPKTPTNGPAPEGGASAPAVPAAPKPPKLPSVTVGKSETLVSCEVCGGRQFNGAAFVGCSCFEGLAKSVAVKELPHSLSLSFDEPWDVEGIKALLEALGR